MLIRKYVDWNGSAAMPATKRLAGVAPEVNLMILLHADDEACKQEIHPGFETHCRHHHNSQPGVSVAPQKRLMSFQKLKKNNLYLTTCHLFPIKNCQFLLAERKYTQFLYLRFHYKQTTSTEENFSMRHFCKINVIYISTHSVLPVNFSLNF